MDKIKTKLKEYKWLLFAMCAAIIFYVPLLFFPDFGLLDDGFFVSKLMNLDMFSVSSYLDAGIGRSIPFTWIFNKVIFELAGYSAFGVVLLRGIELLGIIFLIYVLALRLGAQKIYASLASVFALFTGAMVGNFYQLGTQDHISLVLLLLFSLIFVSKIKSWKQYTLGAILLIVLFLTKEINFFVLFPFGVVVAYDFLKDRKLKCSEACMYLGLTLLGIVLYVTSNNSIDGSIANYDISRTFSVALGYLRTLHVNVLPLFIVIVLMYNEFKKGKSIRNELYITSIAFFSLAAYFPWGVAERYALPYIGFIYVVFAVYLSRMRIQKKHIVILAGIFLANLYITYFFIVAFLGNRIGDAKLLAYMNETKHEYGQVCVQGGLASPEDVVEVHMWLNTIEKLDTSICVYAEETNEYIIQHKDVLDSTGIIYGDSVLTNVNTIIAVKEYSSIPSLELSESDSYEFIKRLETHIPNFHPKRGFETKEFDWEIYKIK